MKQIIQCVPNFSEGRNSETIEAVAKAIRNVEGCRLADVNPGKSTNRTVYTFFGDPESVLEGALASARVAWEKIDMRTHKGEHPRFGAMDVCPFVPVSGVTMADCVCIAKAFGQRISDELGIPVFLYEAAAEKAYRRSLTDIRQGEYEGLIRKLKDPRWEPDFGPVKFVPSWGATAVGARRFLIAYNVNILGTVNQAHRIALDIREAGRGEDSPGMLAAVKGMGWHVKEYNLAQVTVNIEDFEVTPIHRVFEEVKKDAAGLGVGVAGSEIVGLVPLAAVLSAADYYISQENLFIYEEDVKIRLAVDRLGLNSVTNFRPEEKIVEYLVAEPVNEPLAGLSLRGFIEEVSARSTAPGGGSVCAAAAAMGAGLGAMAAKLTYGFRRFEELDGRMRAVIPRLHETTRKLISMIDADTAAFEAYIEATRMPFETEKEKVIRNSEIQAKLKSAVEIPLTVMQTGDGLWDVFMETALFANPACKSDIQVGARMLQTGIWGAMQNVRINIADIHDPEWKTEILKTADRLVERAVKKCDEVLKILENR